MAAIHEQQGDHPAALAAYAELLKIAPTRPRPYYRTGVLWLEQGDVLRATHAMEEAVRLAPDNVEYRAELERVRAAASVP